MINCYHNGQHPYIATASRSDLLDQIDSSLRYPIVHATVRTGEVLDEITGQTKNLLYIDFEEIRSLDNSDDLVDEVRSALVSFLAREYCNNFYFFIKGEFCKVSDMRDTLVGKYAILPLKMKKISP